MPVQTRSRTTQRTHQRLLEATRAEIAATGSFTADRVAERAGTSTATFYSYFPAKIDALCAAFSGVMEDLLQFCERELAIDLFLESGLDRQSQRLVAGAADFFRLNENVFRTALVALPESQTLRKMYRDCERDALAIHERFIVLGQKAGLIRDAEPRHLARALLVLLQGLNNPALLKTRAHDPLREALGEAIFAFLRP